MFIKRLRLTDFRCFKTAEIKPGPGINVVTGDNASGKTSLLEAIFVLGRGQSFRQAGGRPAIRHSASQFTLHGEIERESGQITRLGVGRDSRRYELRKDGVSGVSRIELVNALPVQLVDPNVHRLLEQGPQYRRHFMDWGVFHVEHAFFPAWRRYRRALRQRNRALKARHSKKDVIAWDAELVRSGELVDASRRAYIDHLAATLPQQAKTLVGNDEIVMQYHAGWRGTDGFGSALAQGLEQDQRAGFTQQGPHRSDLKVSVAAGAARDWISRGQQKVLTTIMLLAQARILSDRRHISPVLLIDDLSAELGTRYREALAEEIAESGSQCFLSFLDSSLVPSCLSDATRFHVEHGVLISGAGG